jgi:IS5 family transposase
LTDAQSVKLADRKHKKGVVGYNVQVAVDDKAHLIVEIEATTDKNDIGLLGRMASQTQQALEAQVAQTAAVETAAVETAAVETAAAIVPLKVVADAGYHEANQLEQCEGLGIAAYVPKPLTSSGRSSNGVRVYEREAFTYDAQGDWYLCPHQQELPHRATHRDGEREIKAYYNKSACGGCAFKPSCTQGAFRKIKRRSNEEVIERTAARLQEQPEVFKRRKGLVEHVFGTLRNNGHAEFLMKGKEKISGELHLSALAYNLRRAVNEIGVFALIQAVQIA